MVDSGVFRVQEFSGFRVQGFFWYRGFQGLGGFKFRGLGVLGV